LRHLQTAAPPELHLVISIEPQGILWRLCFNGAQQGEPLPAARLLPMLFGRLRSFAYQRRPFLLTFHAAAVGNDQYTIILPGHSGSGKSTLAASLLARGYRLFSDETAVVDADGQLLPVPLPLGLKRGSWEVLAGDFPGIATLEEHVRYDGQRVRFLDPNMIAFAEERQGRTTTLLCVPRFCPGCSPQLTRLSPVNALRAATASGYQVRGLDTEQVERIIAWLLGLSGFELTYPSTAAALQLLHEAQGMHARSKPGQGKHAVV
jgi:hypothetical protein